MNIKKKMPSNLKSSKKFKYGTSALVFTIVFVAFIILVNVLLSYTDARAGGLYVDLTTKSLFDVSEASVTALKDVDVPVEIIFCQDRDKVEEVQELMHAKMLAESYEKTFKNVKVVYKDIVRDYGYISSFNKPGQQASATSIIINCPSTGLSKIYPSWTSMYKFAEDGYAFAFDGENKITSAILSVARNGDNMLRAGFVTGHGESDSGATTQTFLEELGYAVEPVDLKTIEMSELEKYDVLFVCNPRSDFIGLQENVAVEKSVVTDEDSQEGAAQQDDSAEEETVTQTLQTGVNETGKLYDYVTDHFGNVMFFFDPSYQSMPELEELLADRFGVRMANYCQVFDDKSAIIGGSYNPSDWRFQGVYSTDATTDGYKFHKAMSSADYAGTAPRPAFGMSCLLYTPKSEVGSFTVSPIVVTPDTAYVMWTDEETLEMTDDPAPGFPLMTLSKYTKLVGNADKSGHVVVCGSTGFLAELDSAAYPNADLMRQMLINMDDDGVLTDIEWKVLDDVEIMATRESVNSMTIRLGVIIPVIIMVIGVAVFIKRKYL